MFDKLSTKKVNKFLLQEKYINPSNLKPNNILINPTYKTEIDLKTSIKQNVTKNEEHYIREKQVFEKDPFDKTSR